MTQVDLILTNAVVVTMDDAYQLFPDGGVAVKGDSIVSVGTSADVQATCSAPQVIDCRGRALIPGLVNAHTHVPMALLRGMVDDERLDVWLMGYMMPVEREFVTPEFSREGTRLACAEMIRGGTTSFADMYYYEDAVAEAAAEAGMRAVCAQTVMKFPAPDASSYEDSLAAARDLIERWRGHPLIVPGVAPHAPYTCTAEIMRASAELAMEFDVPVHIHLAETEQEVDQWRQTYGLPIIPWVEKQGLLDAKVIAAHCVHVDLGEIRRLERKGVGIAHNPSSNMKLASGFAPVSAMVEAGARVGLGTDGPASNNDLDMFEEMRLATFMAKAVTSDPTVLPARTTFAMATRWGAKALHLDAVTGSLEPGKRADLVLVDIARLHNVPQFVRDPDAIYSQLVYAGKASDVTDVMVNGTWLLREKVLQTIEEAPVMKAASNYARRIDTFLRDREDSVLSKLVAIGNAEQEESHEVQIKVRLDDAQPVREKLESGVVEIVRTAHYIEYDIYFSFDDPAQGRLRYREDQFIDKNGSVTNERSRLTFTGSAAEIEVRSLVRLSQSRFIAPARHSARFYREYFKPASESTIHKDRLRWLVRFQNREFFINIDELLEPKLGTFLEIKSRTWSRHDAQEKAGLILELLELLGLNEAVAVAEEYPDLSVD